MAKDKPKGKRYDPVTRESFEERQASRLGVNGRLCTHEENSECMGVVMAVAAGDISESEGHKRIRLILDQEPPF